jgi:CRISPR-associated protein Csm3
MQHTYSLHEKIFFEGEIKTLTGLLIGGSDTALTIGDLNKTVIRDPFTKKPYIPGSSLKGKLRALIELQEGWLGGNGGGPVQHGANMHPDSHGAKLCGNAIDKNMAQKLGVSPDAQRPSPLIVRDAYLRPEIDFPYADLGFTHTKTEVALDRITAKANPRTIERVPPGAVFDLRLVLNIFREAHDTDESLADRTTFLVEKLLFAGLELLQDDYLGGYGSRGSGQVAITLTDIYARDSAWYGQPHPADAKGIDCRQRFVLPPTLAAQAHV